MTHRYPFTNAKGEVRAQKTMARLEGESTGRMLGRIEERNYIAKWLLARGEHALAKAIELGCYIRK